MNSPVPQAFSELAAFGRWMQKQGYRYSTVLNCIKSLRAIARRTNLVNPEQVKTYLATSPVSENRKDKLTQDLTRFYKYKQIPFEKPHYTRIEKLPFIPTETEVDQLISGLGPKDRMFPSTTQRDRNETWRSMEPEMD
jgi:hypothetical protein